MNKKSKSSFILPLITLAVVLAAVAVFFYNGKGSFFTPKNSQILVSFSNSTRKYPFSDASGYMESKISVPHVSAANSPLIAEKINQSIASANDELYAEVESMAADFIADYVDDENQIYGIDRTSHVSRIDNSVLSFVFTDVSFTGGVHPNSYSNARNYNLRTGELIHIADITDDFGNLKNLISNYIKQNALSENVQDMYYENWQESIDDEIADYNWYFSEDGITIIINEYIIAPHAAGIIFFTIPYSELDGSIKPDFMPKKMNGNINKDSESFEISKYNPAVDGVQPKSSIIIDEKGEQVLLTASSDIYNVKITSVYYIEESNTFEDLNQYFAASMFSKGDSILISTYIPDVMPNLKLSYTLPDGTTRNRYIFQSGMDGSLMLITNN